MSHVWLIDFSKVQILFLGLVVKLLGLDGLLNGAHYFVKIIVSELYLGLIELENYEL